MTLWVVSGACRRVGKTWLCRQLVGILPQAVYAKVGHNPPKTDKPGNYFTCARAFLEYYQGLDGPLHCVVESNRPEIRRLADIRVFIAARRSAEDVRPDAADLCREADVRVAPEEDPRDWRSAVASLVADPAAAGAVCAALERQREFLTCQHPCRNPRPKE